MKQLKIQRSKVKITREVVFEDEVSATLYEYVGFRVSVLRKTKNISQEDFANKIGLSRMSISNIESGRHGINLKILSKICEVFNLKSSDILPF